MILCVLEPLWHFLGFPILIQPHYKVSRRLNPKLVSAVGKVVVV